MDKSFTMYFWSERDPTQLLQWLKEFDGKQSTWVLFSSEEKAIESMLSGWSVKGAFKKYLYRFNFTLTKTGLPEVRWEVVEQKDIPETDLPSPDLE